METQIDVMTDQEIEAVSGGTIELLPVCPYPMPKPYPIPYPIPGPVLM